MQAVLEYSNQPLTELCKSISKAHDVTEARQIFLSLLKDNQKRAYLLQNSSLLLPSIKRFGSANFLADFLINYYDKSWFTEGLQCFANLAKRNKETDALNKALIKINQQAIEQTLDEEKIDNILSSLMGSEETARIILYDFLQDNLKRPIPKSCPDFIQILTSFFVKSQVVSALKVLNQKRDWNNSYLYRLILMIFHLQHKAIFKEKEYRFSRGQAWQADELKEMILFARRYAHTGNQHDPEQKILKNLLTELVFRAANFGQIGLFYLYDESFDKHMAHFTLEKLTLSLSENIYLWKENIKRHFSKTSPNQTELEKNLSENKAIIDWKKLAQDTFQLNQHNQMPLYKAYLYHYTGSRVKAEKLLHDLLSEKDENKLQGILYHLSDMAFKLPTRDISYLIFRSLENTLKLWPKFIDSLILSNMAHCHQRQHLRCNKSILTQDAMLALIKHFGQQKYYKLVQACCDLMLNDYITDKSMRTLQLKRTLENIQREAKTEQNLSEISHRWYFPITKFFIRLRYYGINHRASSYIKYCDDDKKYIYFNKHPDNITTDKMSGQDIYNQLRLYNHLPKIRHMNVRLKEMGESKKVAPSHNNRDYFKFFNDDNYLIKQEKTSQYYSI